MSSRADGMRSGPERLTLTVVENAILPPRPGFELELTQRLKNEAALDRRFELAGAGSGDLSARVVLTKFNEPTLVRDFTDTPTEIGLRVEARVRIRSGDSEHDAIVSASSDYAPGLGESRDAGLDRLWRDLARAILDRIADRDWLVAENENEHERR